MEMTKVYTKYDSPAMAINVPAVNTLEARPKGDGAVFWCDDMLGHKTLHLVGVVDGLCGVRYFHYKGE